MDTNAFADRWWTSKDGLKLYARDYSGAPGDARLPVICIHGLTRNSRDFEDVAPYVAAAGRRVLAVDVRGRGRSAYDPKPMNYIPLTYARDVMRLFEAAGISNALFIGTSMGGLITMALCALRPRMIAGAVLNDVGPQVSPVGLARIASYVGKGGPVDSWEAAARYARTNNAIAFPHFTEDDWMAFARRTFNEGPDGKPVLAYDPNISVPIRAAGPKALTPNLWPFFRKLARGRPLLVVRGETSDILDAEIARKMRHAAPRMTFTEVPGVGHAPTLSEPAARDAILEFLSKAP